MKATKMIVLVAMVAGLAGAGLAGAGDWQKLGGKTIAFKDEASTFTVETSNAFSVTLGQVTGVTPEPLVIVQRGRLTITTNPTGATVIAAGIGQA